MYIAYFKIFLRNLHRRSFIIFLWLLTIQEKLFYSRKTLKLIFKISNHRTNSKTDQQPYVNLMEENSKKQVFSTIFAAM